MVITKDHVALFLKRLLLLAEIILLVRLVLRFLGANPAALVVSYFYQFTGTIVRPFNGIFENVWLGNYLLDTSTLSAIVGYAIAVFIVIKIIRAFSREI